MNKCKGIIFDMDGTVLNTSDDIKNSVNYALGVLGLPKRNEEEIKSFLGNGVENLINLSVGERKDCFKECLDIYLKHYQIHCRDNTKPYDGIVKLLFELKEKGIKLGLVSNKQESAVKELAESVFKGVFEAVIGDREGQNKKPDPTGVLNAMKVIKTDVSGTFYVGDSEVDIKTAENANIPCISVVWGFRTKEFLIQNGAKIFAETPSDILKIIKA